MKWVKWLCIGILMLPYCSLASTYLRSEILAALDDADVVYIAEVSTLCPSGEAWVRVLDVERGTAIEPGEELCWADTSFPWDSNAVYRVYAQYSEETGLCCLDVPGAIAPLETQEMTAVSLAATEVDSSVPSIEDFYVGTTNSASRSAVCDKGLPIVVHYDNSTLPDGITKEESLAALELALKMWSDVSNVQFEIAGIMEFGPLIESVSGASSIRDVADDSDTELSRDHLYIQMHDNYDAITDSRLGFGGKNYNSSYWDGMGGVVQGLEFYETAIGFVVLDHEKSAMQNLYRFTNTLVHEIGHFLGLSHSSEDLFEDDSYFLDSVMYAYQSSDAAREILELGEYDLDHIEFLYPTENKMPYGFDRDITVVYSYYDLSISGANEYGMAAVDPEGLLRNNGHPCATMQEHATYNSGADDLGIFSVNISNDGLAARTIKYLPSAYFGELSAPEGSAYGRFYYRVSDGVNESAGICINIVGYVTDHVSPYDGLPDDWVSEVSLPSAAAADEDEDGDGVTNFEEYWMDSDPCDPASPDFSITSVSASSLCFCGLSNNIYALMQSTNLIDFTAVKMMEVDADSGAIEVDVPNVDCDSVFYRMEVVR